MFKFIAALALLTTLTSCITIKNGASNTVSLEHLDFKKLDKLKSGESCISSLFFFIMWGSNNISDAAKNGGISQVKFVESKFESYIIFNKFCTTVYGEGKKSSRGGKRRKKK